MKENSTQHQTLSQLQSLAIAEGLKIDKRWNKKTILKKLGLAGIKPCLAELFPALEIEEEITEVVEDINTPTIPEAIEVLPVRITIKNISINRYEISGFSIDSKQTLEIPTEKIKDVNFMKRINHHIEIKKFKLVK